MEKSKVPCHNCEKRVLGCHSTCEDYKEFYEKNKAASGGGYHWRYASKEETEKALAERGEGK